MRKLVGKILRKVQAPIKKIYFGHRSKGIKTIVQKMNPALVNLGCGFDYKKGWLNIDRKISKHLAIGLSTAEWDLATPLPFEPKTLDYVYNEHFIEHLSYNEGMDFLKRIHLSLKEGGVLRIACPDLEQICNHYIKKTWDIEEWRKDIADLRGGCELMNYYMNVTHWEHKYVYDFVELKTSLLLAGFKSVYKVEIGKSEHTELKNLEIRVNSMVLEAMK